MKISELKQPYRRMAEYLAKSDDKNDLLSAAFIWEDTDDLVWRRLYYGIYSPITEEIKTHFPADFDFSVEEESLNEKYTQLAKEGKFDELPDTCEFPEAVELEVWDMVENKKIQIGKADVVGKFKGKFISLFINNEFAFWNFAQLPTPKIDFSQFKAGDVVEVVSKDDSFFLGYFSIEAEENIEISYAKNERVGLYPILKKHIKSITKIK